MCSNFFFIFRKMCQGLFNAIQAMGKDMRSAKGKSASMSKHDAKCRDDLPLRDSVAYVSSSSRTKRSNKQLCSPQVPKKKRSHRRPEAGSSTEKKYKSSSKSHKSHSKSDRKYCSLDTNVSHESVDRSHSVSQNNTDPCLLMQCHADSAPSCRPTPQSAPNGHIFAVHYGLSALAPVDFYQRYAVPRQFEFERGLTLGYV